MQMASPLLIHTSCQCQYPHFSSLPTVHKLPTTTSFLYFRHKSLLPSSRFTRVLAAERNNSSVMDVKSLKEGIAGFYDDSSGIWEDIWGDHMHHGYYERGAEFSTSASDHRAAQIRMIEETLRFAAIAEDPEWRPKNLVDVGCRIGGSSRYLARKYGANCQGITLSPVQAQRANALAAIEGLSDKASFQVADALDQPFEDRQFDLVWSMESGEHMKIRKRAAKNLLQK